MPWGKLDDGFWSHPKVLEAGNEAAGVFARCISWSSQQMTDGFVTEKALDMIAGPRKRSVTRALVEAHLLDDKPGPAGARGYWLHDFLTYNPSREQVLDERAHRAEKRDPKVTKAVRERDQYRCRYCGELVNFRDRKGRRGGTYDQVIPGRVGLENLVVACRECNGRKKRRTPAQAGMPLLAAPAVLPDPSRPRTDPGPDPGVDPSGPDQVTEGDAPGRDRESGRVPGPKDQAPPLTTDQPEAVA